MKVFWCWQSDTPGKTGRHFVKAALEEAIRRLKEPSDFEEPTTQESRDSLHLDHDLQGVAGSPDLVCTILDKIDATRVFVADVTPVASIPEQLRQGKPLPAKKLINPNVAIELGYALKSIGDNAVLMVMNAHYGRRKTCRLI